MSSYFDDLARQVREEADHFNEPVVLGRGRTFIEKVAAIEKGMIRDVSLCTGDREFPDDLRERAMALIARWHVGEHAGLKPMDAAIEWVDSMHSSRLIEETHSLFHEVAQRRQATRFGVLSDSPAGNVVCRDAHDKEQ